MSEIHEISLRERIRLNLISAMASAGINQVQLAERLGISKGTVNNWSRGNNSPDVDMVPRICNVLGISVLDLYAPTRFERPERISRTMEFPPITDDAMALAIDYDTKMDSWGRKQVRDVADNEIARYNSEMKRAERKKAIRDNRQQTDANDEIVPQKILRFTVPQYQEPMSAGTGDPIGAAYAKSIELVKEPPRGTSFIAQVHGDSMEPDYHNGDWVFVHAQNEIRIGQVGVFYMDGREWIKELGEGELISRNSGKYGPKKFTEDIVCQGLVLDICDDSYFEK